ncbi:MAG: TatD family hydrolase [Candidatus Thorarchaeota archaeon]
MIDVHCHIEQHEFDTDREQVISDAKKEGIWMISSAITKDTWVKSIEIGQQYDNVEIAIGLDPMQWSFVEDAITFIRDNVENIIAIGEVGLDHYIVRDHDDRDKQENAFREIIAVSNQLKLPIQIHSRSAGRKALEVLADMEAHEVHMHAFDGKASLARTASRDRGYYFSIPTSVVRAPQKRKLVKAVAIERIMVETDSPVLGAVKGSRNEPKNVQIAVSEIADILHRDEEEMRNIILENTLRLYSKISSKS